MWSLWGKILGGGEELRGSYYQNRTPEMRHYGFSVVNRCRFVYFQCSGCWNAAQASFQTEYISVRQGGLPPTTIRKSHHQIWCQWSLRFLLSGHSEQRQCIKASLPTGIKDAAGALSRQRCNEIFAVLSRPLRDFPLPNVWGQPQVNLYFVIYVLLYQM